jgi:serine/threonine-protein kinase
VGKQAYLPPEQFRGMPTSQSDIYSMGATLHFLLTGQEPEPISVSHPKRVNASVSEKMNSLVEHSTAIDCSKRYEKIEHLERDLMD